MYTIVSYSNEGGPTTTEGTAATFADAVEIAADVATEYGHGDREEAAYDIEKYGSSFADPSVVAVVKS